MSYESERHAAGECTRCHKRLDASFEADGGTARPKSGDIALCAYCATAHVFDDTPKPVALDLQTLDDADRRLILAAQEKLRRAKSGLPS